MSSMLQNLLAVLGIIVIGGIGYYLYTQNNSFLSTGSDSGNSEAAIEAGEFLARLNELKTLNLDESIFNDPRFRSFVNISSEPRPVPVGRSNPFAVSN